MDKSTNMVNALKLRATGQSFNKRVFVSSASYNGTLSDFAEVRHIEAGRFHCSEY